ncbi:hypothetical protein [Streptomyces sp. NBC_00057]|uniref:hypothetical protein n=1 Tax=Streptomyces sp. NBC_00057 TaxID=2975634 RepID=UPI003251F29E
MPEPQLLDKATATPAQATADLAATTTDRREAVIPAHTLVSDLLADMGAHRPYLLTPQGDICREW